MIPTPEFAPVTMMSRAGPLARPPTRAALGTTFSTTTSGVAALATAAFAASTAAPTAEPIALRRETPGEASPVIAAAAAVSSSPSRGAAAIVVVVNVLAVVAWASPADRDERWRPAGEGSAWWKALVPETHRDATHRASMLLRV